MIGTGARRPCTQRALSTGRRTDEQAAKRKHYQQLGSPHETGPWDAAAAKLAEWDPAWAAACMKMTTNPWAHGVLPRKFVELVGIALNAACTNLNPDGTRRHIRAALTAGATRDEILTVLKMASVMSIHSCSLGAPILLEEAKAAGVKPPRSKRRSTPACDRMKADRPMECGVGPILRA